MLRIAIRILLFPCYHQSVTLGGIIRKKSRPCIVDYISLDHVHLLNGLHHLILLALLRLHRPLLFLLLLFPLLSGGLLLLADFLLALVHLVLVGCAFGVELVDHEFDDHVFFEEVEGGSLVDRALDCLFLLRPFHDSFLDGALGHQLVHVHVSALAYSVGSICGLRVHGGIPVIVVEDDRVCCCQRHSQAT